MTLMEWSEALSLRVELVDEQHKKLLDIMNALNSQILHGKGSQGCASALKNMHEYIDVHFSYEEDLMRKSGFPRLAGHIKLHQNFVKGTDDFSVTDCDHDPEKAIRVLNFLMEWFVDHILGPDLVFAHHFKAWKASQK